MQDRSSKTKRPTDLNELAARIVEIATEGEAEPETTKDPAAVSLGRRGGLKGGKARAAKLSPEERQEIAKKAARARWNRSGGASDVQGHNGLPEGESKLIEDGVAPD